MADRVEDLLESFITQRLARNRSAGEIARLLRREVGKPWAGRSIHEISKRDVVGIVAAIEQRGAPVAANKTLKSLKISKRAVAALAASAAVVVVAAITVTFRRTRSAANSGSRSWCSSAQRYSIVTFRPSM